MRNLQEIQKVLDNTLNSVKELDEVCQKNKAFKISSQRMKIDLEKMNENLQDAIINGYPDESSIEYK